MERRKFGKPVRVAIGKTAAQCAHCRGELFVRAFVDRRGEKTDTMLCYSCGSEHLYSLLLGQISAAITQRAERALLEAEDLRKRLDALKDEFPPSDRK
jgi:superfamily II helicase